MVEAVVGLGADILRLLESAIVLSLLSRGAGVSAGGEIVMALPLVVAGLGGLALSAGANLYSQRMSRKLYSRQINAYSQLQNGYSRYLARHGLKINPYRAYERWGAKIDSAQTNYRNSYAGSIGTVAGSLGAGLMLTRRWLS